MKKENKDKQKLELEILELENKIAPLTEGSEYLPGYKPMLEGAEC